MSISAIGHDSHRFEPDSSTKPLVLGGVRIDGCPGLAGNSDADVILHALTNAVSGVTGVNILGDVADDMCRKQKISDSAVFLKKALECLGGYRLTHASVSLEGKRPILSPHIGRMKQRMAELLSLTPDAIGLTATSGEDLTSFGRGEGLQAFAIVTAEKAGADA